MMNLWKNMKNTTEHKLHTQLTSLGAEVTHSLATFQQSVHDPLTSRNQR